MITAEEWEEIINDDCEKLGGFDDTQYISSRIKEIQLDAFKAGMTDAADIYTVKMRERNTKWVDSSEFDIVDAILTARDNKTSL